MSNRHVEGSDISFVDELPPVIYNGRASRLNAETRSLLDTLAGHTFKPDQWARVGKPLVKYTALAQALRSAGYTVKTRAAGTDDQDRKLVQVIARKD